MVNVGKSLSDDLSAAVFTSACVDTIYQAGWLFIYDDEITSNNVQ